MSFPPVCSFLPLTLARLLANLCERPVSLDDAPYAIGALIDFSAIPAILRFSTVGDIIEGEHCHIFANLHFGIEQFIAINVNFAADGFVITSQRFKPVYPTLQVRIEI